MRHIIEASGLRKSYGNIPAVRGIDFHVKKGQLFAFLGPNGAGKSTTAEMLCTLLKPDSGEILIDGYYVGKQDNEIRSRIGVVFQNNMLDDLLSVEENLYIRGSFYGLYGAELNRAVQFASESTGITGILKRKYLTLSGGQKRRVTDSWAIGGILAAPSATAPLGALWVLVDDRKRKLYRDFYTAPISRWKLTGGYLCASYLIGAVMTCVLLAVTQIYLLLNSGSMFSVKQIILILCTVLISNFSGAGFSMLLVSAFRDGSAYSFCSIVIGTLTGFISGNYIPMGMLPEFVQEIIKLCPAAHTAALFRQIIVGTPIRELMANVPQEELDSFYRYMGISFRYGNYTASPWLHVAVLAGSGAVFYAVAILLLRQHRTING